MKSYKYVAKDNNGQYIRGSIVCKNIEELREIIAKQDLFLIKVKEKKIKDKVVNNTSVSNKEVMRFCRKLAIMIKSGLNITDSINSIIQTSRNIVFKRVLINVLQELLKGKQLSTILEQYPKVFPLIMRQMIKLVENGGNLDESLQYLASYLESENRIREKIKSALIYPIILVIITSVVIIVLFTYIVPMYGDIFKAMDIKIPVITQILLTISTYLKEKGLLILGICLLIILILYLILKTKKGIYFKDYLMTKIPIIRSNLKWKITSSLTKSLSMLISNGLSIMDSLETASQLINNTYITKKINKAILEIHSGKKISESLQQLTLFPTMFLEMLDVGEETGDLVEILKINYQYYDEELTTSLGRTISLIEPVMIIGIALIIITVMLAVFIPMFGMMDSLGGIS